MPNSNLACKGYSYINILRIKETVAIDIETVRWAVALDQYEISQHAEKERRNDDLTFANIENAVQTGEVI